MKSERLPQPIIGVDASEQGVEFFGRGASAGEPQVEELADEIGRIVPQYLTDRAPGERLDRVPLAPDELLDLFDLADGGDLAVRERGDFGVDGLLFRAREVASGDGQRHVGEISALVDDGVQLPELLLLWGQRRQAGMAISRALGEGVIHAVDSEPLAQLETVDPIDSVRVLALARLTRPRHLPHQEIALAVFLDREVECFSEFCEFGRQGGGQRHRHGAALRRQRRHRREPVARRQDVRPDSALKCHVVGDEFRGGE